MDDMYSECPRSLLSDVEILILKGGIVLRGDRVGGDDTAAGRGRNIRLSSRYLISHFSVT